IVNISPNAGTPAGGTQLTLLGYGLDATGVQVTIGGQPAKILQATPGVFQGYYAPFMFSTLTLLSPPSAPGIADVTVVTPNGSTTVRGGYQYLDFMQVFPREGALDDMVYDRQRQRLYISNEDHNRVEMFDLRSQTYLTPIAVGKSPTGMALTPDGQLLAVMNSYDDTVSIINPDQMKVVSTKSALTSSDQQPSCQGLGFMISPAGGHRMLVNVICTYLLASGTLHLLDLDSGSLSCSGVASCDSSQENITFDTGYAALASSLDGSKIFLASLMGDGSVGLLDFNANTLITGFRGSYGDATINADGNLFTAGFRGFDSSVLPANIYSSVSYTDAGPHSLQNVYGERLNPSGSLLFMPKRSNVDIFDSHQGRLVLQPALPDPIPYCLHALALDETGSKMFLISKTGLTIAQLHKVPLSIALVSPATAAAGSTVAIRGSGFMNGAIVEFGGVHASTTFGDQNTLQAIVPTLGGDSTAITVVNPDGERYSLHAGFLLAPPKSSIDLQINSGGAGLTTTINGSGPTNSGYAALTLNSGSPPYGTAVFSLKQNGVVVSEAGVPPSPPITSARFFVDYRPTVSTKSDQADASVIVVNTGFAAVNQGMGSAHLTLRLRDAGGNQLVQGAIALAPHAHLAKFIDQLAPEFVLPSTFSSGTGFGTMEIASDLPVSILALRLTTNQRGETLITSTPISSQAQAGTKGSLSFPQFVEGGGYQTTLILMNASSTTETGMIRIYDDSGAPLAMHFAGIGSSTASLPYNIAPGGFLRVQTVGSSSGIEAGSAQVTPDSATEMPVGAGIFGYTSGGILVTESGIPAGTVTTHARVFIERSGGHDTGLAMANTLTGAEALITLSAYALDGITPLGNTSFILGPNAHVAKFVGEFVSGLNPGFTGILDLRSGTPFSALTLRSLTNERGDFLLTTFPVADLTQPAPAPLVFPQIADGGGYQTEFILINPSGSASAVTLNLFGSDGTPLQVGKSGH
ncbi:MAG: IPT/TIG domain-containing protein, partial [Terriglobia bacterium]